MTKQILALLLMLHLVQAVHAQEDTGPEAYARQVAHTSQLVFNGDFEVWEENIPAAWSATKPEALSAQADPFTGKQVLTITTDELMDVRQRPPVTPLLPGDVVIFKVDCFSDEVGTLEAAIRINHADESKPLYFKAPHPGGGWRELLCVVTVPEKPMATIEFRIRVPAGTQAPVQVRSAHAEVVPAIP